MNRLPGYFRQMTMIDVIGFFIFGAFFVPIAFWLGWQGFVAFNAGGLAFGSARILRSDKPETITN